MKMIPFTAPVKSVKQLKHYEDVLHSVPKITINNNT